MLARPTSPSLGKFADFEILNKSIDLKLDMSQHSCVFTMQEP